MTAIDPLSYLFNNAVVDASISEKYGVDPQQPPLAGFPDKTSVKDWRCAVLVGPNSGEVQSLWDAWGKLHLPLAVYSPGIWNGPRLDTPAVPPG